MNASIEAIKQHKVYQQVIKDSFGGVMYNVANHGTYDKRGVLEILDIWETMGADERSVAGGVMEGAIRWLQSPDGRG